ncbi:MAG: Na+/H+ antiporter subunit E [Verrucomicrobia bacterium]|nr:Na+/H+ antiporter subunit E [Verrucomicrobiota bacterium]
MKKLPLFILALLLWVLLVWPVDPVTGRLRVQDIAVGVVVALIVAVVMREISAAGFGRWLNPVRYFWAIIYAFVFLYYVVKANFDVAYRVLHPAMPIEPGIVKVKTKLKSQEGRTALANSVTLTPGTLTVDMTDDGFLYIHWINVRATGVREASECIIGRFEWFLQRIFE